MKIDHQNTVLREGHENVKHAKGAEKAICGTNCNFSAFVIEATRVALENLKEEEESSENADSKD